VPISRSILRRHLNENLTRLLISTSFLIILRLINQEYFMRLLQVRLNLSQNLLLLLLLFLKLLKLNQSLSRPHVPGGLTSERSDLGGVLANIILEQLW
jgi:hypothetical protein